MRFAFRSVIIFVLIGVAGGVVVWMVLRERAAGEAQKRVMAREQMVRLRLVAELVAEHFPPAKLDGMESAGDRIRVAINRAAHERGPASENVTADLRTFAEAISADSNPSLDDQYLAYLVVGDFERVVALSQGETRGEAESPRSALLTGHALSALGKDADAVTEYRRALPAADANSLAWARMAEYLASSLARAGSPSESLELWQRALEIRKREQGGGHPETLDASIAVGRLKLHQSVPDDREGTLRGLIADIETLDGLDADELPALLDQLGDLLSSHGNAPDAESLYRRALEISDKTEPLPSHALRLLRLGSFLADQGRLAEAEPFMRRSVELARQDPGPTSSSAAGFVDRVAKLLRARGERDEAEQLLRKEMSALTFDQNASDMRMAGHLFELACVLQDAGRADEAEPLLRTALALARTSDPPAWEQQIVWGGMLARLLQVKGEMRGAEDLYRSALAVAEERYGVNHAGIVLPLNNLAVLLFDTGRHIEARATASRAYAVAKETLGESDPQTQVCGRTLQGISAALAAAAAADSEGARTAPSPDRRIPMGR